MTERMDPYGLRRVVSPRGALPQRADVLDPTLPLGDDEVAITVEALNVDAASSRQLEHAAGGDPGRIGEEILRIVRARGKLHNPVTGSGGILVGRVRAVGPGHPAAGSLRPGERIVTLVSLTLTPLRLATPETLAKDQYASVTYAWNFDGAWDFHGGTAGVYFSNQVLRIADPTGATQDGAAFTQRWALGPPESFPAALQQLQAEGHWLPADCGGAYGADTMTPAELYNLVYMRIRPLLVTVPGIVLPHPYGGQDMQVMVNLDQQKLLARQLTPADIHEALMKQYLVLPAGDIKIKQTDWIVLTNASPLNIEHFNDIPIKREGNAFIYLRDVATVQLMGRVQQNAVLVKGDAVGPTRWQVGVFGLERGGSLQAGAEDVLIAEPESRRSALHYRADYSVVPEAGHNLMMEKSYRETAETIHRWLTQRGIK